MGSLHRCCLVTGVLGVVLTAPAGARSQTAPPREPQAPQASQAVPNVPPEYVQILRAQAVLFEVLPRVFQESRELEAQRVAFAAAQDRAMVALDPETTRRRARITELESTYNAAAARDDVPTVNALLQEGRQLRRALEATAAEARRRPPLAAQADAFAAALRERLRATHALDAEIVRLIATSDRLLEFVSAAMLVAR